MKYANYSVVRYVPDPARNEALNIGIVLWSNNRFALDVDEAAIARVIRENPRLERDSLLYVKSYLTSLLQDATPPFTAEGFLHLLQTRSTFPVVFTEPRSASVQGERKNQLDEAVSRLLERVVHPRRRGGGGTFLRSAATLERELKPFIEKDAIARHFAFSASRSGVPRSVDFYANSGSNIALDVLNLALARGDDIRHRADAEAFKVYDLLGATDQISTYYVYCDFSLDRDMRQVSEGAERIIRAAGAEVTADLEEARDVLANAASRTTRLFS